jgi:outer membrane protein assembly factor BamB
LHPIKKHDSPGSYPYEAHAGLQIVGNTIVATSGIRVLAFNAKTGKQQWEQKFREPATSTLTPSKDSKTIYACSYDTVFALLVESGDIAWTAVLQDGVRAGHLQLSDDGSALYVTSLEDSIYAIDTSTGQRKWERKTGNYIVDKMVVMGGTIYHTLNCGGTAESTRNYWPYAIEETVGDDDTRKDLEDRKWVDDDADDDNNDDDFKLRGKCSAIAVNASNGVLLWEQDSIRSAQRMLVTKKVVFLVAHAQAAAYSTDSYKKLWHTALPKEFKDEKTMSLSPDGKVLYVASANLHTNADIFALDAKSGKVAYTMNGTATNAHAPSFLTEPLAYINTGKSPSIRAPPSSSSHTFTPTHTTPDSANPAIAASNTGVVWCDGRGIVSISNVSRHRYTISRGSLAS